MPMSSQAESETIATKKISSAEVRILPAMEWDRLLAQTRALVPEAFNSERRILNLIGRKWQEPGYERPYKTPNDGTMLGALPFISYEIARNAVQFAADEQLEWARVDLDERRRRVQQCLDEMKLNREILISLLMWEIGKPFKIAEADVDRCISGVEWYVAKIEGMLGERKPVGMVSNIASWNYPLSALFHAVLVQVLAGNSAIIKTPTDGGLYALTISAAFARRAGLPVSLVSGPGGDLSRALVSDPAVACLSFIGGKETGNGIAERMEMREVPYMLEMEGINAYGVWEFSNWPELEKQIKKGFEYGKQRCTAYVRFVVQRKLFPRFLDTYLKVVKSLRFGHPVATSGDAQTPPAYDFGPLISPGKAAELRADVNEAVQRGATCLFEGQFDDNCFLPGQDRSAYFAPVALLDIPRHCTLYHLEPFGPVDTFLVVDRMDELIHEMNVSNGSLVSSIACDDTGLITKIAAQLRSYKVGINAARSRGDRDETFGGLGQSWKGCFVGGRLLVEAVTHGLTPDEQPYGNFNAYTRLPDQR
jgi:acyl-CoA reductase-like NAD-dependent aldehyde dehydrogenase